MRGVWRIKLYRDRLRASLNQRRAERAVAAFPLIKKKKPHGLPFELILSLTSYPPRYPTLAKTLKSLLDQRIAADRTILWIGTGSVAELPSDVLALKVRGLEIRACEDVRSYTKLVPALLSFPDAAVVTADDDVYYRSDWLEELIRTFDPTSPAIICTRAHIAEMDDIGLLIPYSKWPMETDLTSDISARRRLFPTGVGGILYPPKSLDPAVTDATQFKVLCPTADDLWFFWMAELAGTHHRRTAMSFPLIAWESSQKVGLIHENVFGNANDAQIARLAQAYPLPTLTHCR